MLGSVYVSLILPCVCGICVYSASMYVFVCMQVHVCGNGGQKPTSDIISKEPSTLLLSRDLTGTWGFLTGYGGWPLRPRIDLSPPQVLMLGWETCY